MALKAFNLSGIWDFVLHILGDIFGGFVGGFSSEELRKKFMDETEKKFTAKVFEPKRAELVALWESMPAEWTDNIWRWYGEAREGKLLVGEKRITENVFIYLLSQLLPKVWPTDVRERLKAEEEIKEVFWAINELDDVEFEKRLDALDHNWLEEEWRVKKEQIEAFLQKHREDFKKAAEAIREKRRKRGELRCSIFGRIYYRQSYRRKWQIMWERKRSSSGVN